MGFLLGLYSWGRFLILFMLYLSIINTYLVFNNIYIYIYIYVCIRIYICMYVFISFGKSFKWHNQYI